jgi:salicylate hydroxylase
MPYVLDEQHSLEVAIVGGGITGAVLAIGLLSRGLKVKVYERARGFSEVGAGIGFTPNAEWAMKVIDPRIHLAFKKVASRNASDWFTWINSYSDSESKNGAQNELIYNMYLGERGFEGCHRAQFLDELAKLIPAGCAEFRKNLSTIEDQGEDEKLVLKFHDGTTAQADIGKYLPGPFASRTTNGH